MKTIACLFVVTASIAFAQSGETPVYIEQFVSLQASLEKLYTEVIEVADDRQRRLSLRERLFAIVKTAHGLQERSGQADIDGQKNGRSTDKRLRLIGSGCIAFDGEADALAIYLETNDRSFIGFANDFRKIAASVKKLL